MRATSKENANTNNKRPPLNAGSKEFRASDAPKRGAQATHVPSNHTAFTRCNDLNGHSRQINNTGPESFMRGSASNSTLLKKGDTPSISELGPTEFNEEGDGAEKNDVFVEGDMAQLDQPMAFDPSDDHVINSATSRARPRRQTAVGSEMAGHNAKRMGATQMQRKRTSLDAHERTMLASFHARGSGNSLLSRPSSSSNRSTVSSRSRDGASGTSGLSQSMDGRRSNSKMYQQQQRSTSSSTSSSAAANHVVGKLQAKCADLENKLRKQESAFKQTNLEQRRELQELRPLRRRVTELERQLEVVKSSFGSKLTSLQQELRVAKRAAATIPAASFSCASSVGSGGGGSVSSRGRNKSESERRVHRQKPAYMRDTVSSLNDKGAKSDKQHGNSSGSVNGGSSGSKTRNINSSRGSSRRDYMGKAKESLTRSARSVQNAGTPPPPHAAGERSGSGFAPVASARAARGGGVGVADSDGFILAPMSSLPTHGGMMSEHTRRSTMMPGDLSRVRSAHRHIKIRGLSRGSNSTSLYSSLSEYGEVEATRVMKDIFTNVLIGYGSFTHPLSARAAFESLQRLGYEADLSSQSHVETGEA